MLTREQLALASKYGGGQIQRRSKYSLQVSSQGKRSTGKTAFPLRTAPGPILHIDMDLGTQDVVDKVIQEFGRDDIAVVPFHLPEAKEPEHLREPATAAWNSISDLITSAPAAGFRTVVLDTGDELWSVLRIGLWGKLKGIPQLDYEMPNAMMSNLLVKPQETGINFFVTHKVSEVWVMEEYQDKNGQTKKKNVPTGEFRRDGFKNTDWIFRVDIEHLNKPGPGGVGLEFGVRVLRCTANPDITGVELWGDECTVPILGQMVYPNSEESDWV